MKKITTTTLILTVCALLTCMLTACDPIGYKLEQETAFSNGLIRGNIYSMVPANGKLYTANGYLYTRDFGVSGEWEEIDRPAGASIIKLASDETYLYAIGRNCKVWAADTTAKISSESWKEVGTASATNGIIDNGVFSNSDGTTTGRAAYIVLSDGAHKLNGTSYDETAATGSTADTKRCIVLNNADTFYDQFMVATNGSEVYKVSGTERESSTLDLNGTSKTTTNAITYLFYSGNGQLLVGTTTNYEIWDTTTQSGSPATDTTASLASYSILGIWEYGNVRYASIFDDETSSYSGLWAQKSGSTWDRQ